MQDYQLWIDGQWQGSAAGGRLTLIDPATEQPIASVIAGSRADVDRAVQAATRAHLHLLQFTWDVLRRFAPGGQDPNRIR